MVSINSSFTPRLRFATDEQASRGGETALPLRNNCAYSFLCVDCILPFTSHLALLTSHLPAPPRNFASSFLCVDCILPFTSHLAIRTSPLPAPPQNSASSFLCVDCILPFTSHLALLTSHLSLHLRETLRPHFSALIVFCLSLSIFDFPLSIFSHRRQLHLLL
jgi:hypothetical protein